MRELEAERERRAKTNKAEVAKQKEPRASTTDPQARVMKMPDGGYLPAYNMQIVSDPATQVIVALAIETTGSDRGLARPALEALRAKGTAPSDYLVDGGFTKNDDIEWAHESGIKLWWPTCKPSMAAIPTRRDPLWPQQPEIVRRHANSIKDIPGRLTTARLLLTDVG